jgi:hypothetical protein
LDYSRSRLANVIAITKFVILQCSGYNPPSNITNVMGAQYAVEVELAFHIVTGDAGNDSLDGAAENPTADRKYRVVHHSKNDSRMSLVGHKRPIGPARNISASPLIPDIEGTCVDFALGPRPDSCTAQKQLIDHFVGEGMHLERNLKAKRLCGLQVEHEIELGWLQNRQVRRLLAFENAAHIVSGLAE